MSEHKEKMNKAAEDFCKQGDEYFIKSESGAAIEAFTRAVQLQPDYAAAFLGRGLAYYFTGDYGKAIADYDEAVRLQPDYAVAFVNRGYAYDNKGDCDKAITDYDEAIRLQPDIGMAFLNRGGAYGKKGDYDKAIADFTEAIRLLPNFALAFHNRGLAYWNKGDYGKARADYNEATRLQPDFMKTSNPQAPQFPVTEKERQSFAGSTFVYNISGNSNSPIIVNSPNAQNDIIEDEFINKQISEITLDKLGITEPLLSVLKDRINEIKLCINAKSSLAAIFLCGSTLEGILLDIASKNPKLFNQVKSAPKTKEDKVKQFPDWSLNSFIDVSFEVGFIQDDVKNFSHTLRDFRNYIHPYQQAFSKFSPSEGTAKICFQVLKLAINQLSSKTT